MGRLSQPPLTGHNANVDMLAAPEIDGRTLVLAAQREGHVTVWDLHSRERIPVEQPDLDQWDAMAVGTVDGRAVALYAGTNNTLLRWDLIGGHPMGDPMVSHTDVIEAAVIGEQDHRPVAITGSRDGVVIPWDLRSGKPLGPSLISDSRYQRLSLAMGPVGDTTAAVTVGGDQVRLWSLSTCHQLGDALDGRESNIFCLAAGSTQNGDILIAAGEDGTVRTLDLASGQLNGPVLNGHRRFLGGVGFAEGDVPVVVTVGQFDSLVRVWDLSTYRERSQWAHRESGQVAYSDAQLLATSHRHDECVVVTTNGAKLQIWDLATQRLLAELAGHTGRIKSVFAAELDGRPVLLTASVDSTARLWDLAALRPLDPPLSGHEGSVDAVALSACGDDVLMFTGDNAGVVRAWDPSTRSEVGITLPRLQKPVSCLSPGRLYGCPVLAIGGGDGTIRIWSQMTGKIVAQAQLNTTPQDVVMRPPGDVVIATAMGIVALEVRDWTEGVFSEPSGASAWGGTAVQRT
jgi:WD40 repeat protein